MSANRTIAAGGLATVATSGSASDLGTGTLPAARLPVFGGDVSTPGGSATTTIGAQAVTNSKLANMAANTIKGSVAGGPPVDLTATQAKGVLAISTGDVSGLATVATSGSASDLAAGTLPAARMPALTGDVTTSAGAVATTIAAHAVTYAKEAQAAANTFTGNNTGGTADKIDMTVTQAKTLLGLVTVATSGLASDLTGTLAAAQLPALTGDVTSSAGSATTTLAAHVVTYAKQAQAAANTISGNNTGSTADKIDMTVTQVQTLLGVGNWIYGDASDGTATMDGSATVAGMVPSSNVYTGVREYWFGDLTLNAGITFKPAGFNTYVHGTFTCNGDYTVSGGNGVTGLAGGAGGAAPWAANATLGSGATGPGGAGGGNTGGSSTNCPQQFSNTGGAGGAANTIGGAGGTGHGGGGGGAAGSGGAAGGTSLAAVASGNWRNFPSVISGYPLGSSTVFGFGSGGGGGGGTGGGGGGAGGRANLIARVVIGSGTLRANAGNGGAGSTGAAGGGGGGGGGGVFVLITSSSTLTPTATGGSGGAGGLTGGAGGAGGAGLVAVLS